MTAVVLPIYNQERYLPKALDSLLAQTRHDWQAICVDDGSTDATPGILSEFAAKDGRFKIVTKANGGVSSARNAGLDAVMSSSDVEKVAFLDPDDFYHPQCLELAHAAADREPGAVIEWGYANENPSQFLGRRFAADDIRVRPSNFTTEVWNKLYPFAAVRDVRFGEDSSIAEDAAFLVELFHRHRPPCLRMRVELGFYNEHGSSNMHRILGESDFVERRAVVRRMLRELSDAPDECAAFCRERLPGLLKRFYRDLGRVAESEEEASRKVFAGMLAELRAGGMLLPQRGSLKDFKYYLRFQLMSRRG